MASPSHEVSVLDFDLPAKFDRGTSVVPVLDGTNYAVWKRALRILFMKIGILPVIDHERPADAGARWDRCDRWAFSEIFFSCPPEQQLFLEESMTAHESWVTLADLYQSSSLGNVFRLTSEFNSLRQLPGQPAIQFFAAVCSAASELRYLGEEISDQRVKWQILGHLLPEFGTLVTTLSNIDSPEVPLSLSSLRESILPEERQLALRSLPPTPAPAATISPSVPAATAPIHAPQVFDARSDNDNNKDGRTSRGRCPFCGLGTHAEKNCWHKYPDLTPEWWRPGLRRSDRDKNRSGGVDKILKITVLVVIIGTEREDDPKMTGTAENVNVVVNVPHLGLLFLPLLILRPPLSAVPSF